MIVDNLYFLDVCDLSGAEILILASTPCNFIVLYIYLYASCYNFSVILLRVTVTCFVVHI